MNSSSGRDSHPRSKSIAWLLPLHADHDPRRGARRDEVVAQAELVEGLDPCRVALAEAEMERRIANLHECPGIAIPRVSDREKCSGISL